jgi:hypothetical protein
VEEKEELAMEEWKNKLWKTCVYVITFGMLVALLLGLNMSWSAITAALALIVLDFKDARPCLEKVTKMSPSPTFNSSSVSFCLSAAELN